MPSCTVSPVFSSSSRSFGRASFATSMRRRTSAPSSKSATPRRYLPVSLFCSRKPAAVRVAASRCTVLFASLRRKASTVMPSSFSSPEKELSRRIELATDESRAFAGRLLRLCSMTAHAPGEKISDGDNEDAGDAHQRRREGRGHARHARGCEQQAERGDGNADEAGSAEARHPEAVQGVCNRHAEREENAERAGEHPARHARAGEREEQRMTDGVERKRERGADGGDEHRMAGVGEL